ncbi:MAG: SUMF1/EgtB/PvdO family nonheme iron enzyme [Myxococcales bacterium]|nr:SUMF1/EgtB/PvdO family nonheme iron enzyme [Myxococcales bacterium]
MGEVYLAHDHVLDRAVAIKFVHVGGIGERERYLVEARAAARIQHPNVTAVYRVGELAGRPYIVSEYVRGQTLDELHLPLPWTRALELGIGLARGLAAAHRQGVVHRDIKLANAILDEQGEVKLLDFSLAKLLDTRAADDPAEPGRPAEPDFELAGDDTMNGTLVGTPHYMAPELWRAEPSTRASDIYALGVVLYMLAGGRPPTEAATAFELAERVQQHEPPPLRTRGGDIDPRFAAVVDRCLRRRPSERYASADELRAALEDLVVVARAPAGGTGNPYRGLHAFEAEHRDSFFGRSGEIAAVVDRLRAQSFVLVAGDSGVGKSSLCRAGVLPLLHDGALDPHRLWRTVAVTPGRRPLLSLIAALSDGLGLAPAAVAEAVRDPGDLLEREIRRSQGQRGGFALFVDQLEELVTVAAADEAAAAARLLARLVADLPGVRLLATARGDFLTRIAQLPGLGRELARNLYFLLPLTAEAVRAAIVGPAQARGVRFESEELVERLVTAGVEGSLPLLQFALAELWEARDPGLARITAAALDRIGGVSGALARHADSVLARLDAGQRRAARALLVRLVTVDDTRASLTTDELVTSPESRAALDALVAARLIVVRDVAHGNVHEIAHEALIRGWLTLQIWLDEDREARVVRHRLDLAAAEWDRLGRPLELLWHDRQLAEAAALDLTSLGQRDQAFIGAARARVRRRRALQRFAVLAVPLALVAVALGVRLAQRSELARRIDVHRAAADESLAAARSARGDLAAHGAAAFAAFDAGERERGESRWKQALAARPVAEQAYEAAARALESALGEDGTRQDLRAAFADVLYERATLADALHHGGEAAALIARVAVHDPSGERLARWQAPAHLDITSDPPGARVVVQTYARDPAGRRLLGPPRDLGVAPIAALELPAGSHLLTLAADGRAEVRAPVLLARAESHALAVRLPPAEHVPPDFVHVPAGRFLFGTAADEDLRKGFLMTVPLHAARTDAFLIARHETTWGEWLAFLDSLPPAEQKARLHRGAVGIQQAPAVAKLADGTWELRFPRGDARVTARQNHPLVYPARSVRAAQDWSQLPVSGIDWDDAAAYLAWLDASGRVPGARFCSELEWERAARGADDRSFPHGDELIPSDANYDETYARDFPAMGPDAVGSFPASRSPFGLDDMVGNVFEWTASAFSPDERVARGGGFFFAALTGAAANRAVFSPDFRDGSLGLRVCATPR